MRNTVPLDVSLHWRYLHQDLKKTWVEIRSYKPGYKKFSKATICRHMKKEIGEKVFDKRKVNTGRPKKLTTRDERNLLRQINVLRSQRVNFTIKRLRLAAGTPLDVSDETVRRMLHRHKFSYRHSAKKGVLSKNDLSKRLIFARTVAKKFSDGKLWTEGIAFYLDGVSFTHRYHPLDQAQAPKTMVWRKAHERLHFGLTAKGSHEGNGGKQAHFIVAIGYTKGVIICEQYDGRLNGQKFADFIRDEFPEAFKASINPRGKFFLQDGDPSQNSVKARNAMYDIGARKFTIPPRSPDLNPIENIFNLLKKKLHNDAINKNIEWENFEHFSARVRATIEEIDVVLIDKTIKSMENRIPLVIKGKGQRTKY